MSFTIYDLRCGNFTEPLGVEPATVRLTWKIKAQEGFNQSSFKLIVADSADAAKAGKGNVYKSGVVNNGCFWHECSDIRLKSATRYYWTVTVTDGNGTEVVSDVASFETGIRPDEWQGRYLGSLLSYPGIMLCRSHFDAKQDVAKARIYAAAAGFIELYVNGKRIGDNLLEPVNSDYKKDLYYVTYDVTDSLVKGDNVIGIRLNNGWATQAAFILQGNVTYADGSTDSFCSDMDKWVMTPSGTGIATQYAGETNNCINDKPEWCLPGDAFEKKYKFSSWSIFGTWMPEKMSEAAPFMLENQKAYYAALEMPAPGGVLRAVAQEPVRIGRQMKPKTVKAIADGGWLFDFGQNFTGICKLTTSGPAGTRIKLVHTELLNDDGTPNTVYLRIAEPNYPYEMQTDVYYLKGEGTEEFMPSFTYHGFRFVAVYGLTQEPTTESITGYTVNSDVAEIGQFKADHDMLTWLQDAIMWTEKGNLHSIPTDCPQRAERQGWLNDMTARSEGAVYNLDLQLLYSKWTRDIAGTQDPVSGVIGDTAPYRRGNCPADTVCSSYLLAPYLVYTHYGDSRALREHYSGLKAWVEYLFRNSDKGIGRYSLYGDWAGPEPDSFNGSSPVSAITPGEYMSTCFNCYNAELMEKIATVLGSAEDAAFYKKRHEYMINLINEHYFNKETANYSTGSQACNIFALKLGVVPQEFCQRVADNINADIVSRDYHLSTGNICTKYLPEVLTEYGYIETAMKLINQTTYPSWGYMRSKGATTIWERWEYATGFAMNSHSHPMYGSITAWFYKYLAGIKVVEAGFKRFTVKPYMPQEIPSVSAHIDTPFGRIESCWKKCADGYDLTVVVPPSAKADITLPVNGKVTIKGNAKNVTANADDTFTAINGTYTFSVKY